MNHENKRTENYSRNNYVMDMLNLMYENWTLANLLECYTKADLALIARNKGIKKISNCKKAQLIERIVACMLDTEEIRRYFLGLHRKEIQEVEKAMECDGVYKTKESELFLNLTDALYVKVTDNNKIVIPKDVKEAYLSFCGDVFEKERKKWSYIRSCLDTVGILYGIAPLDILMELVYQNKSLHISREEVFLIAESIPKEYVEVIIVDEIIYFEPFFFDDKGLLQAQANKPFYIPTKAEIISLGVDACLPEDTALQNFQKFMRKKLKLDREVSIYGGRAIQQMIMGGYDLDAIFQVLESMGVWIDNDFEMHLLMQRIMELWNNTRLITNRGYKPVELR